MTALRFSPRYRARGLIFRLSGADVPGEGEIKLLSELRAIDAELSRAEGRGAGRPEQRRRDGQLPSRAPRSRMT